MARNAMEYRIYYTSSYGLYRPQATYNGDRATTSLRDTSQFPFATRDIPILFLSSRDVDTSKRRLAYHAPASRKWPVPAEFDERTP